MSYSFVQSSQYFSPKYRDTRKPSPTLLCRSRARRFCRMLPSSEGIGASPCPISTWLISLFPSPKRNDETCRESVLATTVANEGPGAGRDFVPPLASSLRNPLPCTSISHFICRDWADIEQTATRQKKSGPIFCRRLRMEAICENGKDKERRWECQSIKGAPQECGALFGSLQSLRCSFGAILLEGVG